MLKKDGWLVVILQEWHNLLHEFLVHVLVDPVAGVLPLDPHNLRIGKQPAEKKKEKNYVTFQMFQT